MNKKPGLLISVSILAVIILSVSFNMNLGGGDPIHLREGINPDSVLYVCPAASGVWNSLSESLHFLSKYASFFFSFVGIVLVFSWGWALYQNLLKDKFNEDAYKNSWEITKVIFWLIIVFTILIMTPNHYRRVDVRGSDAQWVLCDNTSDDARAVSYKAVTLH